MTAGADNAEGWDVVVLLFYDKGGDGFMERTRTRGSI